MKEKEFAAKIYLENERDTKLTVLKVVQLAGQLNLEEVIRIYEDIKNHKISIAQIITRVAISDEQKNSLEKKVKNEFKATDLIFVYKVVKDQAKAIVIQIDDKVAEIF